MNASLQSDEQIRARTLQELLISADSHAVEPVDLWEKRLPAAFRERAPNFRKQRPRGGRSPLHPGTQSTEKDPMKPIKSQDPEQRLKDEAKDHVYAEVLYPGQAAKLFFLEDVALQEACFQAYNDWLSEFCQAAPDRLYGLSAISVYHPEHAVRELERCKQNGLCGATIWLLPPSELPFTSNHYDKFWAAAQELDMPVGLHVNTGYSSKRRRDNHGMDAYRYSVNGKTGEITHALFDIIFSGVLERFPGLKIVSAENEIGWIPFWLDQADKFFERYRSIESLPISKKPSEYFNRQVFATFFNDQVGAYYLSRWGMDNYMWSNDYPHGGSMTWPYSGEVIARDLGHLPAADRAKLLNGNVARLYKMKTPSC